MLKNKLKWHKMEYGLNKKKYKVLLDTLQKILTKNNYRKNIKEKV